MLPAQPTQQHTTGGACLCPVCTGLTCPERPRYSAGMLLTESELNSDQSYTLAKNRLHNRYLHGYGIVCGLQVICHDCEGWVTVQPGYALDSCGNDVIVCAATDFNVIEAIRACKEREKRQSDCDPWRTTRRADCQDVEEAWCITLRYQEKEGRPTTALRSNTANRCACGGNGACSCGGNGVKRAAATGVATVTACTPTRILEGYTLGVMPASCCRDDPGRDTGVGRTDDDTLVRLLDALEKIGIQLPLECLQACVTSLLTFGQRVQAINAMLTNNPFGSAPVIQRDLCRLKGDVSNQLLNSPRLNCELFDMLGQIFIPPPSSDNDLQQFVAQSQQALVAIAQVLQGHLIDCVCYHTLPGCPPDPCEDRLVLACVTVRGNRVIRICHAHCRRYVLTAHTLAPLFLTLLFGELCCAELRLDPPGVSQPRSPLGLATAVRTPALAATARFVRAFSAALEPSGDVAQIDTAQWVGVAPEMALAALQERGVNNVAVENVHWSPRTAALYTLEAPVLGANQPVKMFVQNGQVVGFGLLSEADHLRRELSAANARVSRLETQVDELLRRTKEG